MKYSSHELINGKTKTGIINENELNDKRSTEDLKFDSLLLDSPEKNQAIIQTTENSEINSPQDLSLKVVPEEISKSASNKTPKFNFDDLEEMSDLMDSDLDGRN